MLLGRERRDVLAVHSEERIPQDEERIGARLGRAGECALEVLRAPHIPVSGAGGPTRVPPYRAASLRPERADTPRTARHQTCAPAHTGALTSAAEEHPKKISGPQVDRARLLKSQGGAGRLAAVWCPRRSAAWVAHGCDGLGRSVAPVSGAHLVYPPNSSRSALASWRSAVSKPSVNQP